MKTIHIAILNGVPMCVGSRELVTRWANACIRAREESGQFWGAWTEVSLARAPVDYYYPTEGWKDEFIRPMRVRTDKEEVLVLWETPFKGEGSSALHVVRK